MQRRNVACARRTLAIGGVAAAMLLALPSPASAAPFVVTNEPNHFRLAIAHASDADLDSWVFIQARSLSTTPEVCDDSVDNDGDGLADGDDPDCGAAPPPPPPPPPGEGPPPPPENPDRTPVAAPAQPVVRQPSFTG